MTRQFVDDFAELGSQLAEPVKTYSSGMRARLAFALSIAIEFDCPVLAISASDRAGLEPGHRMRARNMKGSTALAYEADVVLVIANKADIVARHHLMYSGDNGEHFKGWTVLTVEKNRSGRTGAEIEFRKDFARGRFVPDGSVVAIEAASVCVHGDSPGAVAMAKAVRTALDKAGVTLRAFG